MFLWENKHIIQMLSIVQMGVVSEQENGKNTEYLDYEAHKFWEYKY